jgi:magnesium-transporting ATPase (P-type)
VGIFSAVTKRLEHQKLAFWPTLLFALIEYAPLKGRQIIFACKNSRCLCYGSNYSSNFLHYKTFTGESIFAIDIASFVIAVMVWQCKLQTLNVHAFPHKTAWVSLIFLALLAVLFAVFSFTHRYVQIFKIPNRRYGIPT